MNWYHIVILGRVNWYHILLQGRVNWYHILLWGRVNWYHILILGRVNWSHTVILGRVNWYHILILGRVNWYHILIRGKGNRYHILIQVKGIRYLILTCPVGWKSRIHQLLLCRGMTPPNECPGYDTKQSDGEAPVMLELCGMQSASLLPSFPGSLSMGPIYRSIRTKLFTYAKLNCLK